MTLDPCAKGEHIKFPDIQLVPESNWYRYTLLCEHEIYSRVRIRVPRDYSYMEHYIRCSVIKHTPLEWIAITKMEARTDEQMRDVSSGNAFVLPNRILRVDGHYAVRIGTGEDSIETIRAHNSGNPFPYSSRDRDY